MSNEHKTDTPVPHVLSFSTDADGQQLIVHADAAGLDFLIRSLTRLRERLDEDICDHDHLFTNEWSGNGDLSTRFLSESDHLVHHVKLYAWTPEWVAKHHLNDSDPNAPIRNDRNA